MLIFTHNALLYSQKDRILFSNVIALNTKMKNICPYGLIYIISRTGASIWTWFIRNITYSRHRWIEEAQIYLNTITGWPHKTTYKQNKSKKMIVAANSIVGSACQWVRDTVTVTSHKVTSKRNSAGKNSLSIEMNIWGCLIRGWVWCDSSCYILHVLSVKWDWVGNVSVTEEILLLPHTCLHTVEIIPT